MDCYSIDPSTALGKTWCAILEKADYEKIGYLRPKLNEKDPSIVLRLRREDNTRIKSTSVNQCPSPDSSGYPLPTAFGGKDWSV